MKNSEQNLKNEKPLDTLKVAILTSANNPYANFIIKSLIDENIVNVTTIIQSTTFAPNKKPIESIFYIIKKSGLFYFFLKIIEFLIYLYLISKNRLLKPITKRKILTLKEISKHYSIPLIKISNINSKRAINLMKKTNPDLIISVFYTEILKKEIIQIPKKGCINLHPSYLPAYRGVIPHCWVLYNEEKETGFTIHYLTEKIDSGDIILQKKINIENDDFYLMKNKLAYLGKDLFIKSINIIKKGKVTTKKQKGKSSYYSWPTPKVIWKISSKFNLKSYVKIFK